MRSQISAHPSPTNSRAHERFSIAEESQIHSQINKCYRSVAFGVHSKHHDLRFIIHEMAAMMILPIANSIYTTNRLYPNLGRTYLSVRRLTAVDKYKYIASLR